MDAKKKEARLQALKQNKTAEVQYTKPLPTDMTEGEERWVETSGEMRHYICRGGKVYWLQYALGTDL